MADSKISDLVDGTTPADTDLFPVARPGSPNETLSLLWSSIKAAVKTYTDTLYPSGSGTSTGTNTGDQTSVSGNAGTATALATGRTIDGQTFDGTANITVIAPGSHAASSKATPVDADELPLVDSAASNVLKKLTWANLKATLKAYTDTLYPSGSGTSSGTNTGDQTTVSGNAGTATALQTARNIDGQSFDGTANITVIAPGTHAATGKTTPVDADELALVDSAASNVLKKLTWANLKATVKAYTDTLYPSGSGTSSGTNTGDQTISDATISTTDITTNNVTSSKHGFAPKSAADATKFLNSATTPAYAQVKDSDLAVTDVTTNNASTSNHGFLKKLDNNSAHFMDGTGSWSTPSGGTADKLGLTPTAVKTSAYGASAGDLVPVDTTSGAVTVTLPTAPADGSVVAIKHVIQGGTNAVTYATGGSDVLNKASGATSGTLVLLAQSVVLQYKSSSAIWYIVAGDSPVGQLDSRYWPQTTLLGAGVYGDGSDGTVTFDGSTTILGLVPAANVYTLTRDIFLAAGTINSGVSIVPAGFRIYCQGTLTNNGTIRSNGVSSTTATGGTGGDAAHATSSFLSTSAPSSGTGANGGSSAVGGSAAAVNSSLNAMGGAAGVGGTGGANAGGSAGAITAPTTNKGTLRAVPQASAGLFLIGGTTSGSIGLVAGGASGGGGGGSGGQGGGGGGGGGVVFVSARVFAGTGAIQARGGNGANGQSGNSGGGGGGGGGFVLVVSQSVVSGAISGQTIDTNAGTKGAPVGTGTNNAGDGTAGTVILVSN